MNDINDLNGRWEVICLGNASFLNFLHDEKVIDGDKGYNEIDCIGPFGYFSITRCEDDSERYTLDYNDKRNPKVMRSIRDYIEKLSDDVYTGKLYLDGEFKFFFTLNRIS